MHQAQAKRYFIVIHAAIILSCATIKFSLSGQTQLVGPLLISTPVNQSFLRLYDLGSDTSYTINLEDYDAYVGPYMDENFNWSFDGCNLLLRGRERNWGLLSLHSFAIHNIANLISTQLPVWEYDDLSLTYSIERPESSSTEIRSYNVKTGRDSLLFALEGTVVLQRWISLEQLLFTHDREWFVWSPNSREVSQFGNHRLSLDSLFGSGIIDYAISPDGNMIAAIVSNALEETEEEITQLPGLRIFFTGSNDILSIDFFDLYVRTFHWSLSSSKILVSTFLDSPFESTDRPGIYYYDFITGETYPVSDYPSLYDLEYGAAYPAWSPDERYITASTRLGYEVYDLATGSSTQIHEVFNGPFQFVTWSPVMDYTQNECQ
jgi:hypothetical protein